MSSVTLKDGVEEPWTIESVAKFIDVLGYRETTSRATRSQQNLAFRSRVTDMCQQRSLTRGCRERRRAIERTHQRQPNDTFEGRTQAGTQRRPASPAVAGGTRR